MLERVNFVIIGEGSSDNGLVDHLEELCLMCGANEVSGVFVDYYRIPIEVRKGKSIEDQVGCALHHEPACNLIFIHRDSDSRNPKARLDEIKSSMDKIGNPRPYVRVVPVQELEAWLLTDENMIRYAAGNPKGKIKLSLPKIKHIENTASPKEVLEKALTLASGLSGRKLEKFKDGFGKKRRMLLLDLDPNGNISRLSSWTRLKEELTTVIAEEA